MSVTTCALSGQPLNDPVVSVKSGHVFEKELIKKHLSATGQCPITGQDLSDGDLVELKVAKSAAPKPLVANNIPSILQMLQGEWDSLMLEVYTLRKNLEDTRKELSHALYQADAAGHVICRLLQEKEELQSQLNSSESRFTELKEALQKQQAAVVSEPVVEEAKEAEPVGISQDLQDRMEKLSDQLIQQRKKQKAPSDYPKRDELKNFKQSGSYPLHQSTVPGILDLDVQNDSFVLTGGQDGQAVLFDVAGEQIVNKFNPYGESAITNVSFIPGQTQPELALIGSENKSGQLGLWNLTNQKSLYEVTTHSSVISDFSWQALNEYVAVGSFDGSWSFHNVVDGRSLGQWQEESPISSIKFHPDGLVLAVGLKSGVIKVYDIRDQKVAMQLVGDFPNSDPSLSKGVSNISFSNKGLYLAASFENQDICRVYSLHKECAFTDIHHGGNSPSSISFDHYGGYLATSAGRQVSLYHYRTWADGKTAGYELAGDASVAKFGTSCKNLYVAGKQDSTLSVYSL